MDMHARFVAAIKKLEERHELELEEYELLVDAYLQASDEGKEHIEKVAREKADKARRAVYGNTVFIRGLIEISNYCKSNCLYCGIRKENREVERYRLSKDEILRYCDLGYELGFRTFVLQGGEDPYFNDEIVSEIIGDIKERHPDCAVTISLGEKELESYQRLAKAGADRYLLRHETADFAHYQLLHPQEQTLANRITCLQRLKKAGLQAGCGFMVGSPYQSAHTIAKDLKFIERFKPEMCGIGPYISHHATPFKDMPNGSVGMTCYLLSLMRLIQPNLLIPATTALASLAEDGRERGIMAGANVIMPNLSPSDKRAKYEIYDNKAHTGCESAQNLAQLKDRMKKIGYEIVVDRGDAKKIG